MRLESHQLFAELCETIVSEVSSSMDLIAKQPGGAEVIRKLHSDLGLAHDQAYSPIDKISWSELKDSYRGAWVIIQGSTGVGAIKASGGNTGSYEAVASSGGEPRVVKDGRGGNIIDFLKGEIGKLQKFYVGKNTTTVQDKKKKRAAAQDSTGSGTAVTQETLVKKFKPLWVRAITAAIADVKGHVANMIKNDAFTKAKKKLNHVETMQQGLESIEAGSEDVPGFIRSAISVAVLMAASYHYPETTGNIERSRYGGGSNSQFSEGPQQLLKDITNGDTAKLGTVLGFFKRTLISG